MSRDYIELHRNKTAAKSVSLSLCYAGHEACRSRHYFGPAVRMHYLIHFVLKGKGFFTSNGRTYALEKNHLFLIKPGEPSFYIADEVDPWEYIWIAFTGYDATTILQNCGLLSDTPFSSFLPDKELINALDNIISQLQNKTENDYSLLGNLYTIFGCLVNQYREEQNPSHNLYIHQALNYIQNNYYRNIKVQDIADHLQIDRTYLYRLFMEQFHMSPKKYLIQYQLKTALQLLTNSDMSCTEIAYACGFSNPSAFSHLFTKEYGSKPTQIRIARFSSLAPGEEIDSEYSPDTFSPVH